MVVVVVVDSAGGVGAATVAVVSNPGPGLPGDDVGVTSLTETLIGPKSFLDDSLKTPIHDPSLTQTNYRLSVNPPNAVARF